MFLSTYTLRQISAYAPIVQENRSCGTPAWFNPALHKPASVPRHRKIKAGTVRAICKQLEILPP